jgi:hypothetical protein
MAGIMGRQGMWGLRLNWWGRSEGRTLLTRYYSNLPRLPRRPCANKVPGVQVQHHVLVAIAQPGSRVVDTLQNIHPKPLAKSMYSSYSTTDIVTTLLASGDGGEGGEEGSSLVAFLGASIMDSRPIDTGQTPDVAGT